MKNNIFFRLRLNIKTMKILSITLFVFGSLNAYAQIKDIPFGDVQPNHELGKCYSKQKIGYKFQFREQEYPIYLGEYHDTLDFIEKIELVISPAYKDWIYHGIIRDRHGEIADIEVVEIDEEVLELLIVNDLTKTDDYISEFYEIKELIEEGGQIVWTEILCSSKRSTKIEDQIREELIDRGYYTSPNSNENDEKLINAMWAFQNENGLPMGLFNIQTLNILGISY